MKILQLCCFTNHWNKRHEVESWDLRNKKNIFDIPDGYPAQFDIVVAAPPCVQFTKANAHHWLKHPALYINIALKCLELCQQTGKYWMLENPPGRIEDFIPTLVKHRTITWHSPTTNKEYIIYSNFLLMQSGYRYNKNPEKKFANMTVKQRDAWDKQLIIDVENCIT